MQRPAGSGETDAREEREGEEGKLGVLPSSPSGSESAVQVQGPLVPSPVGRWDPTCSAASKPTTRATERDLHDAVRILVSQLRPTVAK